MKKSRFMLLFVLIFSAMNGNAQTEKQIRNKIELALISYYNISGREVFSLPKYRNKAYTFGFAISLNQIGKIDTVIFTNQTKILDSLISFKSIVKRLKADEYVFTNQKNTIFVGIALVRKNWENTIDNFYDGYHRRIDPELADFNQYFYNIIPDIGKISHSKNVKLLPAFSLVQVQRKQ